MLLIIRGYMEITRYEDASAVRVIVADVRITPGLATARMSTVNTHTNVPDDDDDNIHSLEEESASHDPVVPDVRLPETIVAKHS
jgi:hypothetical protein